MFSTLKNSKEGSFEGIPCKDLRIPLLDVLNELRITNVRNEGRLSGRLFKFEICVSKSDKTSRFGSNLGNPSKFDVHEVDPELRKMLENSLPPSDAVIKQISAKFSFQTPNGLEILK